MSLPVLNKTWQFHVNRKIGNTGSFPTDNRDLIFDIKQSLIGKNFAGTSLSFTGTWSVTSSSNGAGTFGNNDNVDRWAANSNVIWAAAGVNHSWIVLRQSTIGSEICIDLSNASSVNATIAWSPTAGFGAANGGANGTATARPTATDETALINNTTWGGQATAGAMQVHTLLSEDGYGTRVLMQVSKTNSLFWIFDRVKNPVSGWSSPNIALALGTSGSTVEQITYANLNDVANIKGRHSSINMTLFASTEQYAAGMLGENLKYDNDLSETYPITPIGLVSETASAKGRHGELFDLWFAQSNSGIVSGITYPNGLSRQFVRFGDLIFPWNGSIPLLVG